MGKRLLKHFSRNECNSKTTMRKGKTQQPELMHVLHIFQIFAVTVIASSVVCSYRRSENSPIQLISIRPSTDARMLHMRRDGRYNKNISNNMQQRARNDGPMSPIIKIVQIQRKPKQTKYQRQFQLGLDNGHGLPLHIAPGAYPVYYALATVNGRFKGDEIRSFKLKQF